MTDIDEFVIRNDQSAAGYPARRFVSPKRAQASGTFFSAAGGHARGRAPEARFVLTRRLRENNHKFGISGNNV